MVHSTLFAFVDFWNRNPSGSCYIHWKESSTWKPLEPSLYAQLNHDKIFSPKFLFYLYLCAQWSFRFNGCTRTHAHQFLTSRTMLQSTRSHQDQPLTANVFIRYLFFNCNILDYYRFVCFLVFYLPFLAPCQSARCLMYLLHVHILPRNFNLQKIQ